GKEVLREYRMLLLGQAGGDEAKEEITKLLTQRQWGDGKERSSAWRLWRALSEGVVIGSRAFVEPFTELLSDRSDRPPAEIYGGLVAGQKKFKTASKIK
ncbi:MAG: hypothetical protein LAT58_01985, partial [Opitutales bacterium]|nr:hypothetical protein [Opitutales bacterium]